VFNSKLATAPIPYNSIIIAPGVFDWGLVLLV